MLARRGTESRPTRERRSRRLARRGDAGLRAEHPGLPARSPPRGVGDGGRGGGRSRTMRAVQRSAGALGLGLVLLATAVRRATHVQVLASGTESAFPSTVTSVPIPAAGYGLDRLLTALGKDPFHPERRRPNRRFQLPSDLATRVARRPDDQPASSLRLIGTAVTGAADA